MNFIKKIGKSVYGPEYYQELIGQPFSYSLKYFIGFAAIFIVLASFISSLVYFPKAETVLHEFAQKAKDSYPQELTVTIKGGSVSTNVTEPYFIKMPAGHDNEQASAKYDNLLVIDTGSQASADSLKQYKTAVLLTKNFLVYQDDNGKVVSESLEKVPDMTINKAFIEGLIDKFSPYLKLLYPLMLVGMFFFYVMVVIFRMGYLLLGALLIWLVAEIKNVKIGYGKAYQLGLHLMTLPLLLFSSFAPFRFPFDFTLLLIILAAVNIGKPKTMAVPDVVTDKPAVPEVEGGGQESNK